MDNSEQQSIQKKKPKEEKKSGQKNTNESENIVGTYFSSMITAAATFGGTFLTNVGLDETSGIVGNQEMLSLLDNVNEENRRIDSVASILRCDGIPSFGELSDGDEIKSLDNVFTPVSVPEFANVILPVITFSSLEPIGEQFAQGALN